MTPEERAAWLESLKPGDEVALVNPRATGAGACTIRRVVAINSVHIKVYDSSPRGMWFDRRGHITSRDYVLQPVTSELRTYMRRARLLREIRDFNVDEAPIEVLEKIREVQRSSGVGQVLKNMGDRAQDNLRRNREERRLLGVNR